MRPPPAYAQYRSGIDLWDLVVIMTKLMRGVNTIAILTGMGQNHCKGASMES